MRVNRVNSYPYCVLQRILALDCKIDAPATVRAWPGKTGFIVPRANNNAESDYSFEDSNLRPPVFENRRFEVYRLRSY